MKLYSQDRCLGSLICSCVDDKSIENSLRRKNPQTESNISVKVFFKCHYDYDPANDNLIPCKEAGLRFETGDILQIVNQDDVNWWQVKCKSNMNMNVTLKPEIPVCFHHYHY